MFAAAALTIGSQVVRIDPEGFVGTGHIAPDGETVRECELGSESEDQLALTQTDGHLVVVAESGATFEGGIDSDGSFDVVNSEVNEPFEIALRRFKRSCEKAGILAEVRRREFYEKPTQERKRKMAAAVKRTQKKVSRELARRVRMY